jgi:hypothetical protein
MAIRNRVELRYQSIESQPHEQANRARHECVSSAVSS